MEEWLGDDWYREGRMRGVGVGRMERTERKVADELRYRVVRTYKHRENSVLYCIITTSTLLSACGNFE